MKTNYIVKRTTFGLNKDDTRFFADIIVKANREQLLQMAKACLNENDKRMKRGLKW